MLNESRKMHKNTFACPILSLEFKSEVQISDQESILPISIMDYRSEIQNSDRNSGFPIGNPVFQWTFDFFVIK